MPTVRWQKSSKSREIFTIDRDDFATYRVRRGHRNYALEVLW